MPAAALAGLIRNSIGKTGSLKRFQQTPEPLFVVILAVLVNIYDSVAAILTPARADKVVMETGDSLSDLAIRELPALVFGGLPGAPRRLENVSIRMEKRNELFQHSFDAWPLKVLITIKSCSAVCRYNRSLREFSHRGSLPNLGRVDLCGLIAYPCRKSGTLPKQPEVQMNTRVRIKVSNEGTSTAGVFCFRLNLLAF